jgi:mRNA interferase MazF
MTRGDLVTVAMQGDFGKTRPALVIQPDLFGDLATVTILPVTSTLIATPLVRIAVEPNDANGLRKASQVMVDKAATIRRDKAGQPFGRLDAMTMAEVDRCLAVFLGIAR